MLAQRSWDRSPHRPMFMPRQRGFGIGGAVEWSIMTAKSKRTSPRRVIEIVETICRNPQTATASNLASSLDIPLPTVYRFLDTLSEEKFIATDPSGNLIPGDRMRSIVLNSLQYEPRITQRRAILKRLSSQLDETVSLSIPHGEKLVYFDRLESHWPFQINLKIGDPLPLHCCASGKLYLSSFEPDEAIRVFRNVRGEKRARNTIASVKEFTVELSRIGRQGYALDNEEWFDGMIGASVPIRNRRGALCACLSTHALITRKPLSELEEQVTDMQAAARELEAVFFPEA